MQDESHQLWGDICGYVWSKKGERTSIKMSNYRTSQTWYGAVNIYTGEFILDRAKKADTKYTIDFINWLIYRYKEARHVIIWDGASYHRSEGLRTYLEN
ncbi:transposase [Thioflexithrix psekupsensis]|uniref:transposase n=1 Tax=Thioflexithrix psekupsensis TaxID=1570016 RepID=UPI001594E31C|nr:transposase [Thioflexithrix psekupsensis]